MLPLKIVTFFINHEKYKKKCILGSEYGPDLGPGIMSSSYSNSMRRGTRTLGLQEPDYYHPANTINRYLYNFLF